MRRSAFDDITNQAIDATALKHVRDLVYLKRLGLMLVVNLLFGMFGTAGREG